MHPFIVLEGPDCAGKTTLGEELAKQMGGFYLHLTYRFKDRMHLYHHAALERCLKELEHRPVILDRWWATELVYAAAFRGGTRWPMMSRLLDRVGLRHGAMYVLCMPKDKQAYLDNYGKLKSSTEDVAGPRAVVYDRYDDWNTRMQERVDLFRYDMFTWDGQVQRAAEIISEMAWDRMSVWPEVSRQDRRQAGDPFAPTLMVGDQSNPKGRHTLWPFFEHANSSLWLTKQLEQLCIDESTLRWININDDGYSAIAPERVVALGGRAAHTLDKLGIKPSATLHHPQYYRRFDPHTQDFDLPIFDRRGEDYANAGRNLGLV